MVVQVNLIWVLGVTAAIPITTLWSAVNVTSIVPLGAADTNEQALIVLAAVKMPAAVPVRQSKIKIDFDNRRSKNVVKIFTSIV
jgi:hypothetical protein